MANRKLTVLPELTSLDDNDWGYVVDISDTSESPQGTSKKFRKSSLWDYIRGKTDNRYIIQSIDFPRLLAPQQVFNIPTGKTAKWALVNGTYYVLETSNNTAEFNTFTQTGIQVTFKNTLETGEYPVIFYQ